MEATRLARSGPYLLLGLAAFAVRLAFLLEWWGEPLATVLVGDAAEYDRWAREIAAGRWFGGEVFYQAPLYPYFMALVYAVAGPSLAAVRVVQLALGSIACVLVALAGRRFFDARVGWLAGALLALYGPAIHADALVQKGGLGGFLTALVLFGIAELDHAGGWRWALTTGASLGLLALTRENALLLVPVVAAWLLVGRRSSSAAALVAGVALVLVPVGVRNAAVGGTFLVTTSQAGPNFWIGNHRGATGRYLPLREGRGSVRYEREDATALAEQGAGRELDPAGVSSYWFERARREIESDPLSWLALVGHKVYWVWHADEVMDTDSLEAHRDSSRVLWVTSALHFGILVPLAALGAWVTRSRWRSLVILYLVIATVAFSVAMFYVMARYRNPLVPLIAPFAAAGLAECARRLGQRDWRWLGAAAVALLAVGTAVNWPIEASVDPRAITYYSLGHALADQHRLDEASLQLERAIEVEPDFAEAHVRLAQVLSGRGDREGSEAHLQRALALEPSHADALTLLGTLRFEEQRPEEAARLYRRALEGDPGNAAAHNNLAIVLAQEGRFELAVEHWRASLATAPEDATVWSNLGQVLEVLGRPAEARLAFERARLLAPEAQPRPRAVRFNQGTN